VYNGNFNFRSLNNLHVTLNTFIADGVNVVNRWKPRWTQCWLYLPTAWPGSAARSIIHFLAHILDELLFAFSLSTV